MVHIAIMEIKCSVMTIFYAYVLEREVLSKSVHFKTMKKRPINSLKKHRNTVRCL